MLLLCGLFRRLLGRVFLILFLQRFGDGFLFLQSFGGLFGGLGLEAGFGFDLGLNALGLVFGELLGRHFFARAQFGLGFFSGALALFLPPFEFRLGLGAGAFAGGGLGLGLGAFCGFLESALRVFLGNAAFRIGGFFEAAGGFVGLAFGAVGGLARVAFLGFFAQAGDLFRDLAGLLGRIRFCARLGDNGRDAGGGV